MTTIECLEILIIILDGRLKILKILSNIYIYIFFFFLANADLM